MNVGQTMLTFEEAREKIQEAISKGLVNAGKRTDLMAAIRDRKPFVIGVSGVSPLNDVIVILSQKDFEDIFPQSAGEIYVMDATPSGMEPGSQQNSTGSTNGK